MKSINIMNFVRDIDERLPAEADHLYKATKAELALVNEYGVENTFLLQYDALCDERYVKLFKENATERTELGIWYEIVEPLTTACGMPYRSERGWKWDWHIIPGFSMAYTPSEREKLIDETMRKFKEVFGYYPKTVGSWLIDTHTMNYLNDHYDLSAMAICRDQVNTDAYTLIGGYFNQGYYPSKNNIFTPAQSDEMRVSFPVLRLLGPCPIYNYDSNKYYSKEGRLPPCTLEVVSKMGATPECVDWFFKTFYENESLSFAYSQIGQENSFGYIDFIPALRMQIEKALKLTDVSIEKMCVTGEKFKKAFPKKTPPTAVTALDNWDTGTDAQSVYYDCENYVANLFRYENRIFIRSLFLFDERVKEQYLEKTCTTFDAVYENLPVVDTLSWNKDEKYDCGLMIDTDGSPFTTEKLADGILKVMWNDKYVIFEENKITVHANKLHFFTGDPKANLKASDHAISYEYKNTAYSLKIENAEITERENGIEIIPKEFCELRPTRENQ